MRYKQFDYVDLEHYFIQTLIELGLRANRISDEGAKYIGEALQTNKVRKTNNHFTYSFSRVHLELLIQTLIKLDLYSNAIGDKGGQYLGEGLQKNTVLTTLNVSWNQIGAVGAQYFAEGLKTNSVREKNHVSYFDHVHFK